MDDQDFQRSTRANGKASESTWENTRRKLPAAVLGFLLGALVAALGVGHMLGGMVQDAQKESEQCKAQLAELQGSATVLLAPESLEVFHGAIDVTPGGAYSAGIPLAPQWFVPAKIQPQSTVPGRAYLWIGKSGTPQGPFVAGVAQHNGVAWTFTPGGKR